MDDLPFVDDAEERAHRWASTMAGHADDRIVRGARRFVGHRRRRRDHDPPGPRGPRRRGPRIARHAGVGSGQPGDRGGARSVSDLLRAGPRPDPPRFRVPTPGRQDPGLRLPRRSPAQPDDPRARSRPGRPLDRDGVEPQRPPGRGDGDRPRLRSRSGRPRQRGRARHRSSRRDSITPRGVPT